ncbi:Sporulation related domain-containing protein [Octadecabacter temperatus]|uniref:Cell division protein FtsN n=1 Tax=Octadecabacter temperatus TaxID=1458307 RepID=A0A0K0Y6E0_9RHOB|nr:SPOR domain-containing protein [Octadecabacter temperatus]AKS46412.1 Cell division protein FtsN [Octadecabacter temperatus]SIO13517.1 Sporulation related domain-containing protein [Octadecabacter temperatus]
MADFAAGPNGGNAGIPAGKYVNVAAAAISVALIGGVGIWGYKLLMRDVTGVPVVRALSGEMRVAPENPGGEIANHVGLSVNSVPAIGGAAEPEDRLVLAPSNVSLQAEDMEVTPTAEAVEVVATEEAPQDRLGQAIEASLPIDETLEEETVAATEQVAALATPVDPSTPLTAADVLALADQIAAGAAPMTDLAEGETAPIEVAVNGVTVNPDLIPDAVPGVRRSPRPAHRPANRPAVAAVVPAAATTTNVATPVTGEVTTAAIPVGTKLVQLGAFDSADIAATEWVRMTARFPDFFAGKEQVIQQANSGGRTFFRLRATGFSDLSDARRFCAAMSAEGAACIPVVVR